MTRILIVDDDPASVAVLAILLEQEGYEVISAADAKQGLTLATERAPAVIISDVIMPDKSGLGMLLDLRCDERTRTTPVVFYTGWNLAGELALASEVLGRTVHVVSKPAHIDQLLAVIRTALGEPEGEVSR